MCGGIHHAKVNSLGVLAAKRSRLGRGLRGMRIQHCLRVLWYNGICVGLLSHIGLYLS